MKRQTLFPLLCLLAAAAIGVSVSYGWYFYQRQAAVTVPIDSPTSIYINAAHMEDIQFMDLADVDMEAEDSNGDRINYKDFVFTVQGEDIAAFKLQLAYTTNNQLTFELYEATEQSGVGGLVDFYSETDDAVYSYNILGSALPMRYLNAQAGNKLANNALHTETYGSYSQVNRYAEPLYCQTVNTIAVRNREGFRFHNYFILRVRWSESKMNDRETDMLYIAARAASL